MAFCRRVWHQSLVVAQFARLMPYLRSTNLDTVALVYHMKVTKKFAFKATNAHCDVETVAFTASSRRKKLKMQRKKMVRRRAGYWPEMFCSIASATHVQTRKRTRSEMKNKQTHRHYHCMDSGCLSRRMISFPVRYPNSHGSLLCTKEKRGISVRVDVRCTRPHSRHS